MRLFTANIHANVDGYGRRTDALGVVTACDADLLFVQELWRGQEDDVAVITHAGWTCVAYEPFGTAHRFTQGPGGRGWEPPLGLLSGDRGLYFTSHRPLSPRRRRERDARGGGEVGEWGVGLFTRHRVESVTTVPVRQLRRDKTGRTVIWANLVDPQGQRYVAIALHGPHLSHGSLLHYRGLARYIDLHSDARPIVMAGDFNCWRPLLRVVFPKWRSAIRARTWPAWMAHSQIDHVLLRGQWSVTKTSTVHTGSDHLALAIELNLPS